MQEDATQEAVVLDGFDGDYMMRVAFIGNDRDWITSDYRHRVRLEEKELTLTGKGELGRALIFQESEKVFYFVGHNCRLTLYKRPPMDGSFPILYASIPLQHINLESVSTTEGHFDEDGNYQVDMIRTGDEGRHSIWLRYDVGVVRVEMI